MQALHEKYKDKGFLVLGISVDQAKMEKVANYVKRLGITFTNLHDSDLKIGRFYGVNAVPLTYIFNKNGKAIGAVRGLRQWMSEDFQKLVQQLLDEKELDT